MNLQNIDGYGSHLVVLETLRKRINFQRILEFGGGEYSTTYFHSLPDSSVTTIETQDYDWYLKIKQINPNTLWIPDHEEVLKFAREYDKQFDLLFLDTHQDLRYKLASIAKDYCRVIVLHDSETSLYKYHEIPVDCMKYHWADFVLHRPWTSILTRDKSIIDHVAQSIPCIMYDDFSGKLYTSDI